MKQLPALALLAVMTACSNSNSSAKLSADSSALEVTKPNNQDFLVCDIEWTQEKVDAITKLNNFDLPLPVDVALFKSVARQQLEEIFGEVPTGKVHYQDMYGTGERSYYDFARLYYTAPMPSELSFNDEISMAYAISANGQSILGFTKTVNNRLQFAKPGMMAIYRKKSEDLEAGVAAYTKEEFLTRMAELQKTVAPDLIWNKGEPISASLLFYVPVALPENPSADQIKQFVTLWKTFENDPANDYVEYDGESIIGTPTTDDMILIKDSQKTVDMNALRTKSLRAVRDNGIFLTLPTLPKPFGEGCTILNPKVDGLVPEGE